MRRPLLVLAVTALLAALLMAPAHASSADARRSVPSRPIVVARASQSNNWSGYNQGTLEQGGKQFHSISGDWVVPTARAHKAGEAEYSSAWIGIGGGCIDAGCTLTDATLIQAGTEQDVDASGKATYSAWWELIPAPGVTIDPKAFPVQPGDAVHFDITESPAGSNLWTITAANVTRGKTWKLTVPYVSTHLTAEWIVETPVVVDSSGNVSVGPLPKLSPVRFDNATVNGAGAALTEAEAIQLVDFDGKVLATPSAPDADANGFTLCSYASTCRSPRHA